MATQQDILNFYTNPGEMTLPGKHAPHFDALPSGVAELARITHGLWMHEHIAPAYGVSISDERRSEVHVRSIEQRLDCLLARDSRPLTEAREPGERMIANCRHYTVLMVTMLRARGAPARARCGFGAYFEPGKFVDHWVCEYWNESKQRWTMVDAQIDDLQRGLFKTDFDLLDVPRDRFLVAADAWTHYRDGRADPERFGILDMHGLWFIAGNLVRDLAALNNMEMLPWDSWGAMTGPVATIDDNKLAYFDRLAELTRAPDACFDELRQLYETDERLRVPPTIFNAVLNRPEPVRS